MTTHPAPDAPRLLPCPFCGKSDPAIVPRASPFGGADVWCKNAECDGNACDAEAWNRRAPAVQPAAGREEIARIVLKAAFEGFEHGECEKEWEPDYGREIAAKATDAILAAISTPAQASGEPVAWARRWFIDGVTPKKERNENGRMAWPKKFTYHEVTRVKVMKDDVALYAHPPAQASESGGVDPADIAARLHPDLFSSDERTAHRAASPYAVSIKRAEAVAEVGRVLAAAAALSAPQAAPACFAENANQDTDPRVTEWGYSSTDEALTHLGTLLDDQAAFDGLAQPNHELFAENAKKSSGEGEGES